MENQNRTIGESFPRSTGQRVNRLETTDTIHVMRCAEDLFSDQIVRRFPDLIDINRVDVETIEQVARVTVTLAPIFLRVWRELEDQVITRGERRQAA